MPLEPPPPQEAVDPLPYPPETPNITVFCVCVSSVDGQDDTTLDVQEIETKS